MWAKAVTMTVGAVLTAAAGASAAPQLERPRPMLAVSIVDLASVPRQVLGQAAEDVTTIYDMAGVTLVWNASRSLECCAPPADAHWVRVVLHGGRRSELLGGEVHARPNTMAFTPCGTSPDCRIAYVFFDRIEELARLSSVPASRLLALAIAHEIGHMLLPQPSHSPDGIMRPALDVERAILPLFTAAQAGVIRARLDQRRNGSDR